jgi:NAD(P)H-flavin reductase
VQVDAIHGVLQLQVPVPRDWVYIPGQSIRLWCRDLGLRARWRLVPFTIANRTHDDHQDTLYLYTRPLSYGPMMHLEPSRHPRTAAFHALVLGPHGRPHNLRRFGTVILIASDVGIAEVLPYVQTLIDASRRRDAMVRRIHLIWQVDDYREWQTRSGQRKALTVDRIHDVVVGRDATAVG